MSSFDNKDGALSAIHTMQELLESANGSRLGHAIETILLEIERLRTWKSEAMIVLSEWEEVYKVLGRPGRLGDSMAIASKLEIGRIKEHLPSRKE